MDTRLSTLVHSAQALLRQRLRHLQCAERTVESKRPRLIRAVSEPSSRVLADQASRRVHARELLSRPRRYRARADARGQGAPPRAPTLAAKALRGLARVRSIGSTFARVPASRCPCRRPRPRADAGAAAASPGRRRAFVRAHTAPPSRQSAGESLFSSRSTGRVRAGQRRACARTSWWSGVVVSGHRIARLGAAVGARTAHGRSTRGLASPSPGPPARSSTARHPPEAHAEAECRRDVGRLEGLDARKKLIL